VSDDTMVITLPTTGQLPIVQEPSWEALVPVRRPRRRRTRPRPGDSLAWYVQAAALGAGWGGLVVVLARYVTTLPVV